MLAAALITQLTVSLVNQGLPTLTPFLRSGLHLDHAQAGFLGTSMYIGGIATAVIAGWGVDVFGQRRILVWGGCLTGLLVIVASQPSRFVWLVALLALTGVAASTPTVAGSKAVMNWFPPSQRGMAMGIRQTGIPLGGALAAAILPFIAATWGWRAAVAASGCGALAGAGLCALLYRSENPPGMPPPEPAPHSRPWDMLSADIVLLGAAGALLVWGQFCLITYLPLFLHADWNIPILTGSLYLLVAQLAAVGGRIFWGRLSDQRFAGRRKPVLVLICLLATATAFLLGHLPTATPRPLLLAVVGFFGFVAISWNGLYVTLSSELAGPDRAGRAIGFTLMSNQLGIIAGPVLFGHIIDVTHSYPLAWTLLSAVLLIGTACMARITEPPRAQATQS